MTRRSASRGLATLLAVGLVVGLIVVVAVRAGESSPARAGGGGDRTGERPARPRDGCCPRLYSHDLALGIVIGYAYSDGSIEHGTYLYDKGGEGLADQFRAAILDAGGTVSPMGEFAAKSIGLPDLGLETHGPLTAAVLQGSADLRMGVLTGMVQCEGDPKGLVWDSPIRSTAESVVALLATFGITAKLRGSSFFDVVVGPEAFPFFQSLPVAVRDRVPGTVG